MKKKNGKFDGGMEVYSWVGRIRSRLIFSTELDHFVLDISLFNAAVAFLTTIATSKYVDGIWYSPH